MLSWLSQILTRKMKIKLFNIYTKPPTKSHPGDAGFDVYSQENITLWPFIWNRHRFNLGFAIQGERGFEYRIEGRSGLAFKKGITTIGNIIDNGYRGEAHAV